MTLHTFPHPRRATLLFSIACCCLGLTLFAQAQSTWRVLADSRLNRAVWMASATQGWAVGELGMIHHTSDGGVTWTEQNSGITGSLNGVWGTNASNVWAVGDGGTILKYDGANWTPQPSTVTANLYAVHGIDAATIWAVGASATLLKWDGANWAEQSPPNGPRNFALNGVFAVNATNVWAVGANGRILKGNGTAWTNQDAGTNNDLYAIWAATATQLMAVGEAGTVRVSTNGTTWAAGPGGSGNGTLRGITGTDGSHIWIVGDGGTVRFYNGSGNFTTQTFVPANEFGQALHGVFAASDTAAIAVGFRKTFHRFNGTNWIPRTSPTPITAFNGIWGSDDDDVWFAGPGGSIIHYNGSTFSTATSGVNSGLNDLWGADAGNVWAVGGNGTILKWNGTTWSPQNSGVTQTLSGVFGTSATDVWAVGNNGTILHFNGTVWSAKTSGTTAHLTAVWAAGPTSVWAVGVQGTILKYNGASWSAQTSGSIQSLTEVAGSSATSVWTVGSNGTVLKFNGTAWSLQAGGTPANLHSLAVINATNQWAAGSTTIIKGSGAAWAADNPTGFPAGISTMWASSVNTVFLAAASGMIFTNSPALVPEITVEQPAATALQSGKDTIDFGPAVVPGNAVRTFTVRSTGSADLTGLSITKSGTHANDFAVGALGATTLAPGASTTFEVTFTPSADGARTALISIASNDLDEPLFTISLTGTGQVAVSFSTHPVSKSVNPNTAVSFTCVVAAGVTKPITYQWQKYNIGITAWENVTGATAASYTIPKALEAHEGDYRCMATNPVSAVPSNAATLLVNEPVAITSQPLPLTVGTGSSFSFTVATTGSEPKKYVWRRNGAAIAGAPNLPTYTVNAAQIAHAGDYSVIVSNPVNTLTSANANLTVIDTAAKTVKASAGTKAVLTASYSGKPTGFVWKKGGDALPADFRYTYVKNVLSIAACQVTPSDDSGMYTCEITGLDGNSVTSTVNLVVYNDLPEVTGVEPLAMPDAMIGDPTYSHQIPFNPSPLKSPTSFTAAGLPTGLTCNATTGLITGNPSVALTANKTYSVTLTATNARGKSAKKANLTVKALPSATVGVYAGPVERSPALNNNLGGRFELTTTTNGSFTGKVVLGKTSYAIKGRLISDVSGTAAPSGTAIIKRTLPLANLTVSFRFDPDNHVLQDCDITDATAHVAFAAWHKRWGTVMSSADSDDLKTYLGYYTFGIVAPVPAVTPPTTASEIHPQGVGYGAFTVGASGALTAAGKLADGTAFTSATFCGPRGEVLIFQTLYTSLGSILGTLDITQGTAAHTPAYGDNTLDGGISWLRPQMLGTNRVYRSGFGPLDCEAAGGRYVPPLKPALLFGVADDGVTNNATLAFTEGGLSGTTTDPVGTQTKPDVEVRIKSSGVFVPTNPRGTTLTLAPTTGLFSGKATLIDANPAKPGTNITRVLNYYGIVSRDGGGQFRGYAFFFLARRPDELSTQTITTTDQLSGQVVFEKK